MIHLLIKFLTIFSCTMFIACENSSEFEKELIDGKGAWNTFVLKKNDSVADYQYLTVFGKDKSWENYMRSTPHSNMIVGIIDVDTKKGISKWSFNKNDSIFELSEDEKYKLIGIKNDTILLDYLFNKDITVILVRDRQAVIPETQ